MTLESYRKLSIALAVLLMISLVCNLGWIVTRSLGKFGLPPTPTAATPVAEAEPVAPLPSPVPDVPQPAPTPSPIRPALSPAPPVPPALAGGQSGAAIRWGNLENGCAITQDAGKFHISGTTALSGWGHPNGVRTADNFPDGDFTVSVDFKVPEFSGGGSKLAYLRASSEDGNIVALRFAGGYQLQRWTPSGVAGNLRAFGDEKTTFHRLTLKYDAAAKSLSGWVDDRFVGQIDATLAGRRSFWLDGNTDGQGVKIDLYFENFTLLLGNPIAPTPVDLP